VTATMSPTPAPLLDQLRTVTAVREQARAAGRAARAAAREHGRTREVAEHEIVDLVVAAHAAGASLRVIGPAAGLTHQRAGQIIAARRTS
jgi:predicted nucleic acid-binding protein